VTMQTRAPLQPRAFYPRRHGMTDEAFAEWAATLTVIGEEAFLPSELDGRAIPRAERPVQTCAQCGRDYIRASYRQHVDEFHNADGRQRYWRDYRRRKREAA
jgi:hypothetical protein